MINSITTQNINYELKNINFKDISTEFLGGLGWMKNNPSMAACAVDFGSMVAPRTYVETKERGKQSGIETFIREISSLTLHGVMGFIGYGAASFISGKFNKEYGIKAQNIFASGDTIQNLSEIWNSSKADKTKFFEGFVNSIKGLNVANWNGISKNEQNNIVKDLMKLAEKNKLYDSANSASKTALADEIKNLKSVLIAKITKCTGANSSFKLSAGKNSKEVTGTIGVLVDNAVSLSNAFETVKNNKKPFNEFVKKLMNNKSKSTLLGLGVTSAMCISIQPINRMLTKKRTGSDGFVGVDSKENDNSTRFKILKTIAGISFPIFAISTIEGKVKDLLSKVQFNGKLPSINQFKLIYGLTIGSRLLASRDENELRENLIKDGTGYSTWLLFGDFVSKSIARVIGGKDLINNPIDKSKKGIGYAKDWLMQSSVKSFEEILMPKAKTIVNKGKTIGIKELYKNAAAELKYKTKIAAFSQTMGYLFSGVVLGAGISELNIFITRHFYKPNHVQNKLKNNSNFPFYHKNRGVFNEINDILQAA